MTRRCFAALRGVIVRRQRELVAQSIPSAGPILFTTLDLPLFHESPLDSPGLSAMTLNYHLAFDDGPANPSNRLRTFLEERIGTHSTSRCGTRPRQWWNARRWLLACCVNSFDLL